MKSRGIRVWLIGLVFAVAAIGLFNGCANDEKKLPVNSTDTEMISDAESKPQKTDSAPSEEEPSKPQDNWKQYKKTVNLNSDSEGIKILGERILEDSEQLNCDWTCSGFEFVAEIKGGNLSVRTSVSSPAYFRVYVDGEEWKNADGTPYFPIEGTQNLVIFGIPVGVHTIRIITVTGYTLSRAQFYSMTFYGELLTEQVPADHDLYIEFVGDSISCGWGTIGDYGGAYTDQDGALAYPYQIAQEMNVDYSVTALSGQGLLMGNPGMTKGYLYGSPLRSTETEYAFSRKADIVVVNIGTNDYGYRNQYNITEEAFRKAYRDFLLTVFQKNGEACKIYCLYNTMNDTYADAILEVCEELGGEEAGIYTFRMNRITPGKHPSLEEHRMYTEVLTDFIKQTKDQEVSSQHPGQTDAPLTVIEAGNGIEVSYSDPSWD